MFIFFQKHGLNTLLDTFSLSICCQQSFAYTVETVILCLCAKAADVGMHFGKEQSKSPFTCSLEQ